jgi:threonine-phosphate decarboxylase
MAVTHGGNLFEVSRAHGWDWREVLDFSASINPLGPSPHALEAIQSGVELIAHYPERDSGPLRTELAHTWNIDEAQILTGNGATELIDFLARVLPSTQATLAVPAFTEFHRAFPHARCVPANDPSRWPTKGLFIVTRPLNPTGELLDLDDYLAGTTHPVLVDECFIDFTGCPSLVSETARRPNLCVLRSLTKFYALPGLRVGALAAAADTVGHWRKQRAPWQVNVLAERAAIAALRDSSHYAETITFVHAEREWLHRELTQIRGVHPRKSTANYVLAKLNYSAEGLRAHLCDRKLLTRVCTGWPGIEGEAVRAAVRSRTDNQKLIDAWREYECAC